MCLAIPGKIIKVDNNKLVVKYPKETREVLNSGLKVKVGDYVMVQMGIAVSQITSKEAQISLEAWKG